MRMGLVQSIALLWLSTVFVYAGTSKLVHYQQSRADAVYYVHIRSPLVVVGSWLLPWVELSIGAGLLAEHWLLPTSLVTLALGLVFGASHVGNWVSSKPSPCPCGGAAQPKPSEGATARVQLVGVVRSLLIVGGATVIAASPSTTADGRWAIPVSGVLCTLIVVVAARQAMLDRRRRAKAIMVRKKQYAAAVELLESYTGRQTTLYSSTGNILVQESLAAP